MFQTDEFLCHRLANGFEVCYNVYIIIKFTKYLLDDDNVDSVTWSFDWACSEWVNRNIFRISSRMMMNDTNFGFAFSDQVQSWCVLRINFRSFRGSVES